MVMLGCATWAAAMAWNSQASACSPPQEALVHVPAEVPEGGLIVGQFRWSELTTADLVIRSGGVEVAGTFVEVTAFDDPSFFAFQPSAPLPLTDVGDPESGLFVSVEIGGRTERVVVTAANTTLPSATGSTTSTEVGAGTYHDCEDYSPSIYGLCSSPAYWSQTATRVGLQLAVEHDSQHLYRATYSVTGGAAGSEVELVGLAADVSAHWFDGAPEEVCYSLSSVALDGTEVLVGEECLSTEALGLGTVDSIYGDVATTLEACLVPPAGEEELWCAHFADAIAAQNCEDFPSDSCAAALDACDSGGEYNPGTGGTDSGNPDYVRDELPDDTDRAGDADGGGCSTGRGAGGGSWPAVFGLLALAAGVMRRREKGNA